MEYKGSRVFNVILGIWLLLTPSFWPHTFTQSVNTAIVGLLATVVALIALDRPTVRFLNVCLGTWLVVSAFAMRHTTFGTQSNNVIVGVILTFVALDGPASTSKRSES